MKKGICESKCLFSNEAHLAVHENVFRIQKTGVLCFMRATSERVMPSNSSSKMRIVLFAVVIFRVGLAKSD